MDILVERCAALDVHKGAVAACVRIPGPDGGRQQALRTLKATTAGLLGLADWLESYGVTLVGMESTGCYWKPCWQVLEDRVCCWLLNTRHARNLPGRKTDLADAAWLCQLVEHGMVRPSFVPPRPIRELRDLTRYRKAQIQERTREVQRLDKVLQDAGIKLSSVASKTLGRSVRLMLEAMIGAPTTRRCSPAWPGGGCGPSCRRCGRHWLAGSAPSTTGCWSARSWRTSTTWTSRSRSCPRGSSR